jgi:hypothetical protein
MSTERRVAKGPDLAWTTERGTAVCGDERELPVASGEGRRDPKVLSGREVQQG